MTSVSSIQIMIAMTFMALALVLAAMAIRSAVQSDKRIVARLEDDAADTDDAPQVGVLATLGAHLTLPGAEDISRLRFQLAAAGYYADTAVRTFFAIRVLALFVPQFAILVLWGVLSARIGVPGTAWLSLLLGVAGLFGPGLVIRHRTKRRIEQCRRGFPDMMDLLVAAVEAGLGLDSALARVTGEIGRRYPVLKINLDLMNLELRAGRSRHEALFNFADRVGLEEAKSMGVMLKQAEDMGSSLGVALRTFSEDMRTKRMLRAEEKAMALSAKLTVPLILFIFPTLLVMILVPAGIRLLDGIAG